MTPKEKAKELVWKYLPILESWKEDNSNKAKQCAIIAVDEMMKQCWDYRDIDLQASYDYWNELKHEIEKL
jgi:hypothetical protein